MSNKIILSALVGAAVCYLPAYSKTPTAPQSDAAFLTMAAQADMVEAHIGKMAEDRAATDKVKDFGKTLVQDHTSDYDALTALSTKTGDPIPKAIDKENDHAIATLDQYKGKQFDRTFLMRQSAEHQKLIKAFKEEAEHGSNPDIKAYANKALATIERHLHDAQDLLKQKKS